METFHNVSWIYNRCKKSGNRKKATGETGIRQKRNVTPESIGLVSIKAQADIWKELRCFRFYVLAANLRLPFGSFSFNSKSGLVNSFGQIGCGG
jgi:hypothetical protein